MRRSWVRVPPGAFNDPAFKPKFESIVSKNGHSKLGKKKIDGNLTGNHMPFCDFPCIFESETKVICIIAYLKGSISLKNIRKHIIKFCFVPV